jgi:hypothetical protein
MEMLLSRSILPSKVGCLPPFYPSNIGSKILRICRLSLSFIIDLSIVLGKCVFVKVGSQTCFIITVTTVFGIDVLSKCVIVAKVESY